MTSPTDPSPTDPIQPLDPAQQTLDEQQATHHNFLVRDLVALDQLGNVMTDGLPDETISACMAR